MTETAEAQRVREILAAIKPLAAEFYRLTGKPLGATGEIAEYVAAELLGLELAPARQAGFDAIRRSSGKVERIQIKGRAFAGNKNQRLGTIKLHAECDVVLLVIMSNATLDPREILEAEYAKVCELLARPGKAHERGSLGIGEFRRIAKLIWSSPSKQGTAISQSHRGADTGLDPRHILRSEEVAPVTPSSEDAI